MNLLNYSKFMIAKCLVLIEYLFTLEPIVQVSLGQASVILPLLGVHSSDSTSRYPHDLQHHRDVTLCVPTEQSKKTKTDSSS